MPCQCRWRVRETVRPLIIISREGEGPLFLSLLDTCSPFAAPIEERRKRRKWCDVEVENITFSFSSSFKHEISGETDTSISSQIQSLLSFLPNSPSSCSFCYTHERDKGRRSIWQRVRVILVLFSFPWPLDTTSEERQVVMLFRFASKERNVDVFWL